MTKLDYFVHIHDAADATALRGLRQLADADPDLTVSDLAQVNAAIGRKFSRLNAAAVGKQTPRWGAATHPVRIPTPNLCR